MLIITTHTDAPIGYDPIGIKEQIAMRLEDLGDTRVVEIREVGPEQMRMEGG